MFYQSVLFMMNSGHSIFPIICSIGMINGIFLAAYFAFAKCACLARNFFLALLFGFTSLRIGKFLVTYFNMEMLPVYHYIWFGSLSLTGILVYFTILSFIEKDFKIKRQHLLHLIPVIFILLIIGLKPFADLGRQAYRVTIVIVLIYLILTVKMLWRFHFNNKGRNDLVTLTLLISLTIGALLLWMIHFISQFFHYNYFMVEALLFSGFVYLMTFWILKNGKVTAVLFKSIPFQNMAIQSETRMYIERIENYLNSTTSYLRNTITMPEMAKELKLSPHLFSKIINENYHQNFNDLINQYRVEHAKRLLKSDQYKNITLSNIAFESGFSSISVFNNSFKKFTGQTPSQYKSNEQKEVSSDN